jgi:Lipase (class 3)
MPSIHYDSSRVVLYTPEQQDTLFKTASTYTELQVALECARLAYVRAEDTDEQKIRLTHALSVVGFESPTLIRDVVTGTEIFATHRHDDGCAVIACRGTQPGDYKDLISDLSVISDEWTEGTGRVHLGFAKAARTVLPPVQHWIDQYASHSTLIFTGHSLGAAVATLLASVLRPKRLFTIGSPRVGDREFAASLDGVDVQRIVNCCDAVTEVPLETSAYTHVGERTYINRDGVVVDNPHENDIKADRSQARVEYLKHYSLKKGSVLVRDLADHAPINYLRAFF